MERLFSRVLSACVLASIHAPASGEDEVRMGIYEQIFLFDGKTTGDVTRVVTRRQQIIAIRNRKQKEQEAKKY
ncbi:hypothetical protein [Akkermansia muciniphila]|uniref:hypothetical protein n=1 Tax=Akkermansia muciniphila TaxID=239935 RepID=UPI00117883EC|nr:hypothetical protein [Akkermansia muciniphila]